MNHTALQSAVSPDTLANLRSIIYGNGVDNTLKAIAGVLAEHGKTKTAEHVLVARTESLIETPIAAAPSTPVKPGKWTQKKLEEAFDRVKDPADWKAPIAANVLDSQMDITIAAIVHFTATSPRFVQAGRNDKGEAIFHVTSLGYRAGPAGDH
jgi:hypothetical protein